MSKYIEVHNYRFTTSEAALFQSGVWERFIVESRENNNHVRRLLEELLLNPHLVCHYEIVLTDQSLTKETICVKVNGTNKPLFKAVLTQDSARRIQHRLGLREDPRGTVASMWNASRLDRERFREQKYRDFLGKTCFTFDSLLLLVEKALARMSATMLGDYNERHNSLRFTFVTKNIPDHEISLTLYAP